MLPRLGNSPPVRTSSLPRSTVRNELNQTPADRPPRYPGPPLLRPRTRTHYIWVPEEIVPATPTPPPTPPNTPVNEPVNDAVIAQGTGEPGDPIVISDLDDDLVQGAEDLYTMSSRSSNASEDTSETFFTAQQPPPQTVPQPVPVLTYIILGSATTCNRFCDLWVHTPEFRRLGVIIRQDASFAYRSPLAHSVHVILNGPNDYVRERVENRLVELGLTKVGSRLAFNNYFYQKVMMIMPSVEMRAFGF